MARKGTAGRTGRLERLLRRARWVLAWEALWPLFWPLPSLILLFLALALFDVLPRLGGWVHLGVLLAFAAALAWAGRRLFRYAPPGPDRAERRLEEDSGLAHRPLAALKDRLALGGGDPASETLWAAERRRLARMAKGLRLGLPRPVLAKADPLGLRFAALGLFLVALTGPSGEAGARIGRALLPALPSFSGPAPVLQVWITPPAYTRMAPMLLDPAHAGRIGLPEGSQVMAELQGGGGQARLVLDRTQLPFQPLSQDSQRVEAGIGAAEKLAVRQGWRTIAAWDLAVVGDRAPSVRWNAPPRAEPDGRLRLFFTGEDDYGLPKARAVIRRADLSPDAEALTVDLPLGPARPGALEAEPSLDLTGHPWAGLAVAVAVVVEDDKGQTGATEPLEVVLPERQFTHPVARAVVALRRHLIVDPRARPEVAAGLRALALNPQAFGGDLTTFLGLSVAGARLRLDMSAEARASVVALAWELALRIEDGDRPAARLALDQATRDLETALANGAPATEIERLTEQLRQAMARYLDALAESARRKGIEPGEAPDGAEVVTPGDLQEMLDRMKEAAGTGARDAARQMLSQMRQLLDGLQAQMDGAAQGPGDARARRALSDLDAIAQNQQGLLDETFRRARPETPPSLNQPGAEGLEPLRPGRRGSDGAKGGRERDLAAEERQRQLGQRLGRVMETLDALGQEIPPSLGQAGEAMADAARALGQGRLSEAMDAQGEALSRLREGAQAAAQAMAGQGAGIVRGQGRGRGDPFGRGGGNVDGESVVLPTESEGRKAREVLDELRRRSADTERPAPERDYLRRLLRNFF